MRPWLSKVLTGILLAEDYRIETSGYGMVRILSRFLVVFFFLLIWILTASDCFCIGDPNAPDTVMIDSVATTVPQPGIVSVYFVNDEQLDGIEVTLTCNSPDIRIDSFSFSGGRVEPLAYKGSILADHAIVIFAYPSLEGPVDPGRGLLGRLWLSYDPAISEQLVAIDTSTVYMADSMVIHSTWFSLADAPGEFSPVYTRGYLDIQRCCAGPTGNIDCDPEQKANLADITRLIDFIYLTRTSLCCFAAGNTDGDPDWKVNLSDVTRLIDHVYLSKEATALCP